MIATASGSAPAPCAALQTSASRQLGSGTGACSRIVNGFGSTRASIGVSVTAYSPWNISLGSPGAPIGRGTLDAGSGSGKTAKTKSTLGEYAGLG